MKKIAILIIIFATYFSSIRAQERKITTSPAYDNVHPAFDNVHLENSLEKKMRHNAKYALLKINDNIPNGKSLVFKYYFDLSNRTIITFPNREEYIKTIHFPKYIKGDFK